MRLNDRRAGSIKTLLILVLIAANIAVALAHHRAPSESPGNELPARPSAGASRALFGALAENFPGSPATRALGGARALPEQPPR